MPKAFKNSKELYIYPAIFSYKEDDTVIVNFPDIPCCYTSGNNDEEAVYNAKEVLSLCLYGMEEDGDDIPSPTPISEIKVKKNEYVFAIDVWMPYHRSKIKTQYIKKTLTIPNWLNVLAEQNGVNFSQLLQKSLLEYLGVSNRDK